MKLSLTAWSLLSFVLGPAFAAPPSDITPDDASTQSPRLNIRDEPQDPKADAAGDLSTTFNGIKVPRMKELEGFGFEESIKDGHWYADQKFKS